MMSCERSTVVAAIGAVPIATAQPQGLVDLAFGVLRTPAPDSGVGLPLGLLTVEMIEFYLGGSDQRRLGDYELKEMIGEGGMGVVYRARQISLAREVAVKVLAAGPWASRDFVERFHLEAQNAARMQHPNIVPIYEVGTTGDLHFFSMALIAGPSLATLISQQGRLPALEAAWLLRTIAEAIDYAHRLGVLHLDLKPGNVLLDSSGTPHVADFGLARRFDAQAASESDEVSGTPSYMAPEQARVGSQKITPATDIWGLGAILYEMVTGKLPFEGNTPQGTLHLVVEGKVRAPRRYVANLSRDIEAIILKCLSREVCARYATARDLADDLNRFIEGRAVRARPLNGAQRLARWARREPKLASAASLALAALLIGLLATAQQWRRADRSADEARVTAWQARRDAARTAFESSDWFNGLPGLAANVAEQERNGADATVDRLRIRVTIDNSPRLIDEIRADGTEHLALSPDGARLMLNGTNSVSMYDVATGLRLWISNINGTELGFETDGQVIQSREYSAAAGTALTAVLTRRFRAADGVELPVPPALERPSYLVYSGNGRYAAVGYNDERTGARKLQVWRTDTWQPVSATRLLPPVTGVRRWLPPTYFRFSGDGSQNLLLYAEAGRVEVLDRTTLTTRLVISAPDKSDFSGFEFSPDSRYLGIAYNNGRVELVDLDSGKHRELPRPFSNRATIPSFSEDSSWVAVGSRDGDIKVWETATTRSISAPLRSADEVDPAVLDRGARLLLAQENRGARVWSLPPKASEFAEAVPVGPRLHIGGHADVGTINATQRLLVTQNEASKDVRFWRLPLSVLRKARAAPLHEPDLAFDGTTLADVGGRSVDIVDAWSEQPLSPPFAHPQPPSFAQLTRDGRTLVVVSGRELFAWDWRAQAQRFTPIAFPGSPQRIALNPSSSTVLVVYLDYREDRMVEMAQVFGLADGKPQGAPVAFPGPLRGLRFTSDGRNIVYWRGNEVSIRDARSLRPTHEPIRYGSASDLVIDARLDALGRLSATTQNPEQDNPATLWQSDSSSDALITRNEVAASHPPISAVSRDGFIVLASGTGSFLVRPGRKPQPLQLPEQIRANDEAAAFSPDGRVLALSVKDGVQLFESATAERIGPPLRVALEMHDGLIQLAFAPDGRSLLALTAFGRQLLWRVAPDDRPATEIVREVDSLAIADSIGDTHGSKTRAWLRSHDSGPPPPSHDVDLPDPNETAPPRSASAPDALIDLSRYYSSIVGREFRIDEMFDLRQMPLGIQRFAGVDFDVRGLVQLRGSTSSFGGLVPQNFPSRVDGIGLPETVAAIDLLFGEYDATARDKPAAEVTLKYHDGGKLRQQPSYHLAAFDEDPIVDDPSSGEAVGIRAVRTAWLGRGIFTERWRSAPQRLYIERVVNPDPMRRVESFSIATSGALFLVAATVERPKPSR